jgi:hypothetical protein
MEWPALQEYPSLPFLPHSLRGVSELSTKWHARPRVVFFKLIAASQCAKLLPSLLGENTMRIICVPLTACLLFVGCASPFVLMVNPKTSQSVECSGVGRGLMSAIAVSNQVDNCVRQYESLGYVQANNLTAEQRATLNVRPPERQHRTVTEYNPAIPTPVQSSPRNCTSQVVGSSVYTNCY